MCDKSKCCRNVEALKTTPKECTPEQIAACHGDEKKHPCVQTESAEE